MSGEPASITQLVRCLKDTDPSAVERSLAEIERLLTREALSSSDMDRLAEALARAARHPQVTVRHALTRVLERFRHASFESLAGILANDSHDFVRRAARRLLADRVRDERTDALGGQQEEVLTACLSRLEQRHGRAARDAARDAGRKYASVLLRATAHEAGKFIDIARLGLERIQRSLEKDPLDRESAMQAQANALSAVGLLSRIVHSVLDVTKDSPPVFESADFAAIVREAAAQVTTLLGCGEEAFHIDIPEKLVLEVDRAQLLLAIGNLLKNAVESYDGLEKTPKVSIRARPEEDGRIITKIADEGCGMGDEIQRRAFRLFETTKPGGSGLGLPIAHGIIEGMHRGAIHVKSRPGEGTVMTVVLPVTQTMDDDS